MAFLPGWGFSCSWAESLVLFSAAILFTFRATSILWIRIFSLLPNIWADTIFVLVNISTTYLIYKYICTYRYVASHFCQGNSTTVFADDTVAICIQGHIHKYHYD